MKFIRDIIAEKANMTAQQDPEADEQPVTDTPMSEATEIGGLREFNDAVRGEDLDPVHQVASGGISLGAGDRIGSGRFESDPAEGDDKDFGTEANPFDFDAPDNPDELSGEAGHTDGSDALPPAEDPKSDDSELFGDIWAPGDQSPSEPEAGQNETLEDDPFRSDVFELDDGMMQEAPPEPPAPAPESEQIQATGPASAPAQSAEQPPAVQPPAPEAHEPETYEEPEEAAAPIPNPASDAAIREMLQRRAPAPAPAPAPAEPARAEILDSAPAAQAAPAAPVAPDTVAGVEVPAPSAGRAARKAGRVKTRLLGFGAIENETDPFAQDRNARPSGQSMYPVGWIVIADGPGRGNAFTLFDGVSQIGRGEDQAVRLDFGDNSISRSNHAAVAYDREGRAFFLGHGGKANLVRLNGAPVLSTEPLHSGAEIRIGETTLRFISLCGENFDWDGGHNEDRRNAQFG